jgi:GMP synthase (glutamine-hydrolysing)
MNEKLYIIKHAIDEGPGVIGDYFQQLGWDISVIELSLGESLPDEIEPEAAVIMLGGPMNVYEEEKFPFLRDENGFIQRIVDAEVPFLGICLGGQLLAKAFGGAITRSPVKEVGWDTVKLSNAAKQDQLFKDLPHKMPVYQWHEDTFAIPPGAVQLASSDGCHNQAFRIGSFAYGIQFHPEVTPEMESDWAYKAAESSSHIDAYQILHQGKKIRKSYNECARTLCANFRGLVGSATRIRKTIGNFVDTSDQKPAKLWWNLEARSLLTPSS